MFGNQDSTISEFRNLLCRHRSDTDTPNREPQLKEVSVVGAHGTNVMVADSDQEGLLSERHPLQFSVA